jgi:hypothetical protein
MTSEAQPKPRKTGRALKAKGDIFERELAAYLSSRLAIDIRRAPLSGGGVIHGLSGGADLSGTPGVHIEAKRVEALSFPTAMAQAEASLLKSGAPEMPVVINRRNRQTTGQSYTLMRLDDFITLYAAWLQAGRPTP